MTAWIDKICLWTGRVVLSAIFADVAFYYLVHRTQFWKSWLKDLLAREEKQS